MTMKMNIKMRTLEYKKLLSKYTLPVLNQIRYVADCLDVRSKDKLTLDEDKMARIGLRVLAINSERRDEILDLMRYDWDIFEGAHIRFSFSESTPLVDCPIKTANLKKMIAALDAAITKRNPSKVRLFFEPRKVFVQGAKKKRIALAEKGTYQTGLLDALGNPNIGITRTADSVFEIINSHRKMPTLNTPSQKKNFIRGTFREIQRKLKDAHLSKLLKIKWGDNGRTLQLIAKR
jgi:hypothetical protein